jgi:hypothetical protein
LAGEDTAVNVLKILRRELDEAMLLCGYDAGRYRRFAAEALDGIFTEWSDGLSDMAGGLASRHRMSLAEVERSGKLPKIQGGSLACPHKS